MKIDTEHRPSIAIIMDTLTTPMLNGILVPDDHQQTIINLGNMPEDIWRSLSSTEQVRVRMIRDFWNGSGHASFYDIISRFDEDNLEAVIHAMRVRSL